MSTRLKTRSDYHVFDTDPEGFQGFNINMNSWLKPLFWIVVGAILGMSYNKKAVDSCYDLLAFSEAEKTTTVVQREEVKKPTVIAVAPTVTHATARANPSSRV